MSAALHIYGRRCWVDGVLQEATITVEGGEITRIQKGATNNVSIDAGDNVVMPGVIDAHVHVNDPGRADWEGFETATMAAIAGGITTIVDMPLNSSPVTTTLSGLAAKIGAAQSHLHCDVGFWAGITHDAIQDLEEVLEAGCLGVKAFLIHSGLDEFPNVTREVLDKAMPIIAQYDVPLLVHCELELQHTDAAGSIENPQSYQAFLSSRPREWENAAVRMMIELCQKHQCRTHIVHLSSVDVLPDIQRAKVMGLPLTVETCPHYIYFSSDQIPDGDPRFKCTPPIRDKSNNDTLRKAVASGLIDFIASDHSPAPPELKALNTGDLTKAWGGIAGIQFLLPASWTAMRDQLTLEAFIPLMTEHPAGFIGLNARKGKIAVGYDADITIWSPDDAFEVREESILFRHKLSPYIGEKLHGIVDLVVMNGNIAWSSGKVAEETNGDLLMRVQSLDPNLKGKGAT